MRMSPDTPPSDWGFGFFLGPLLLRWLSGVGFRVIDWACRRKWLEYKRGIASHRPFCYKPPTVPNPAEELVQQYQHCNYFP